MSWKKDAISPRKKIDKAEGETVEFDALLVSDDEGKETKVGTPTVSGVKVIGKIMEQGREKKISVIKFKSKSRYRRNVGHRQPYTKCSSKRSPRNAEIFVIGTRAAHREWRRRLEAAPPQERLRRVQVVHQRVHRLQTVSIAPSRHEWECCAVLT